MNKTFLKIVVALVAVIFLLPAASQAAQKKIVIKIGHVLTESSAKHQGFLKFKAVLEASSDEFVVELYPNGQMGGDREVTEATQLGNLTMSATTSAPMANFEKDFFIFDVPFMFADRKEAYAFMDGEAGQYLLKKIERINLVGMGLWENGFRNLTNSRRAVRMPEDVKGIKLRTMENPLHLALWRMLGANPAPMAFGEVYTALQQKTMDGQENPFGQIYDNKLFEVQPYITKTRHLYQPFLVCANKAWFDKLTPKQKELVVAAMKEATAHQRKMAEKLDDEKAALTQAAGRELIELTAEQRDAFRKAVAPVLNEIKSRVSPEIFAMYEKFASSR